MRISNTPIDIRVISHNIRYANVKPSPGEELWEVRCPRLLSELQYHTRHVPATFICLQEVLHRQLEDILHGLNVNGHEWQSIGVGRDDGKEGGEYSPTLFRSSVWKSEHFKTVWLSKTPDRPSKSWDAASVRILTVGVFRHRDTGHTVVAMNTHLDDQGKVARREAAKLIVEEANSWTGYQRWPSSLPLFLAGDINSTEDEEAYKVLTYTDSPLRDIRLLSPSQGGYGFTHSWTGFDGKGGDEGLRRLDFIFYGHHKGDWWNCRGHAILGNRYDDGVFLSDHRAVVGDLELLHK